MTEKKLKIEFPRGLRMLRRENSVEKFRYDGNSIVFTPSKFDEQNIDLWRNSHGDVSVCVAENGREILIYQNHNRLLSTCGKFDIVKCGDDMMMILGYYPFDRDGEIDTNLVSVISLKTGCIARLPVTHSVQYVGKLTME